MLCVKHKSHIKNFCFKAASVRIAYTIGYKFFRELNILN